MISSCDNKVEC